MLFYVTAHSNSVQRYMVNVRTNKERKPAAFCIFSYFFDLFFKISGEIFFLCPLIQRQNKTHYSYPYCASVEVLHLRVSTT